MTIMVYDHKTIEKKWQTRWQVDKSNEVTEDKKIAANKRRYILDMFPYPSGAGLHVGHPEGYSATDIYARYLRMNKFQVLHPMGWDAFGLPAENYAIKQGVHPKETTDKNIKTFRRQIKSLGLGYDWSREINTASKEYYKWTQWFFLLLYKNGLAYRKKAGVNWCKSCKTVLAREQVIEGTCERCKSQVIQKELRQWFFKITDYAERLLGGLEDIDWPEPIKLMQRNWIGKSEGIVMNYPVAEQDETIFVFTTRPDTNYGATFIALAPDTEFVKNKIDAFPNHEEVKHYVATVGTKTELERIAENKEKTGVFTGLYAINQLNDEKMPIYVADFVLASVGTGAVVGVPGHDIRDFEFAQAMKVPIVRVVVAPDGDESVIERPEQVQEEAGTMINSDFLNGMDIHKAKEAIMDFMEKKGWGKREIQYKLRDWLISRQRYWGAPIPIIYCDACGEVPVPEKDLPVELPETKDFKPTGESPLKKSESFHNVMCPKCGASARRESDTMDTFVCSSWYLYRYTDPHNDSAFANKQAMKYWMPVDVYVGGSEHAVMHLLYARFFCKVLYDQNYIEFEEPFKKLINQGLILASDGRKMSKSLGNVINPDDVVDRYGADTLRMYEMFMGPLEDAKPWSTEGIKGIRRFLDKVYAMVQELRVKTGAKEGKNSNAASSGGAANTDANSAVQRLLHKTIKKVGEDIENFKFNTAIAQMMILLNLIKQQKDKLSNETRQTVATRFLLLLAPFAPHMAEELFEQGGNTQSIFAEAWPTYDPALVEDTIIVVPIQVNGKLRGQIDVPKEASEEEVFRAARAHKNVKKYIDAKKIIKEIYVTEKIVNFVVQR